MVLKYWRNGARPLAWLSASLITAALLGAAPFAQAGPGHNAAHSPATEQGSEHGSGHGDDHAPSSVGVPGKPADASRTVQVELLDSMRFQFQPNLSIQRGETIAFVVHNPGRIRHEFSIGSESEQKKHREAMRAMPDMMHDDLNAVTVDPGQSKTLTWRFDGDDNVVFACNIPGHSEAGMILHTTLK